MRKAKADKPPVYTLVPTQAEQLREQACQLLGHADFSELTICVMLRQLIRKRRLDAARDLLVSYTQKFPLTGPVLRLKAQLDAAS